MTGGQQQLNYAFVPDPPWVQDRYEAGLLSAPRRDILLALFRRAKTGRLARRQPTPDLRLVSLARATHRDDDRRSLDALGRLLRDMRKDGELNYATRGTGDRTIYVFLLYPDGPRSGVLPGSETTPVPGSEVAVDGSGSAIAAGGTPTDSGVDAPANGETVPGSTVSVPGSEWPSRPVRKPDSAEPVTPPVPTSSDRQENPKSALTEGSASRAHARESTGDEIDEADLDRAWARSRPKGYAWEPGA